MNYASTVNILSGLLEHIEQNQKAYGSSAAQALNDCGLPTVEEFESVLGDHDDTLEIGIVGRVKAGKSTILNALFFDGEEVLPKAATPMTAALTILSYDQEPSIEIVLYSKDDIKDIEKKHRKFQEKRDNLIKKYLEENSNLLTKIVKKDIDIDAIAHADDQMRDDELSFYYHCYEDIHRQNDQMPDEEIIRIKIDNVFNINEIILDYVGSDGKYTAFTKSVHLRLPFDSLKGIQVVDTPGINDPVMSREKITRKRLKMCDVVFIVTPTGQFLNNEDVKLIDRIASSEKAREIFIIGSKIDSQLFNIELKGDVLERLNTLQTKLSMLASSTFRNLKRTNLEVDSMYDELIKESEDRVILVSSYAQSMVQKLRSEKILTDDEQKLLNRLAKDFQSEMSDPATKLQRLTSISKYSALEAILNDLRNDKNRLITEANDTYIQRINESIKRCKDKLLNALESKLDAMDKFDLAELKQKHHSIKELQSQTTDDLDDFYIESVRELKLGLSKFMKERITKSIDSFEVLTQTTVISGGVCSDSRRVEKIRTGAAYHKLELLVQNVEEHVSDTSEEVIFNWKKKLRRELTSKLETLVHDDVIDINTIRSILSQIYPSNLEINYKAAIPQELAPSGTLTGQSARDYVEDIISFGQATLKSQTRQDIKLYIKNLEEQLMEAQPSKYIFKELERQVEELAELVTHKEETEQ